MSEQRKDARQRTFLRGSAAFNDGRSNIDCTVRDMTRGGARLSFGDIATLPEVFDLHIANRGQSYRAIVRWRSGCEVGVSFSDAELEADDASEHGIGALVERIRKMEFEVANIRKVVNEIRQDHRQRTGQSLDP